MDKIFWPLLGIGIILLFTSIPGYVEATIAVTFVLLVVMWIRMKEIVIERETFKRKLTDYLTHIEQAIIDSNKPQVQQTNGVTKEEMNDTFDKFAKKLIDMENKMVQVKKTLAAAFSALDERIRAVEEETFPEEQA